MRFGRQRSVAAPISASVPGVPRVPTITTWSARISSSAAFSSVARGKKLRASSPEKAAATASARAR
jgi:hypothetical protein